LLEAVNQVLEVLAQVARLEFCVAGFVHVVQPAPEHAPTALP
jgi:hypothetical protein